MKSGIAIEQKEDGINWAFSDILHGNAVDPMIGRGRVIAHIPGTNVIGQALELVPFLLAFHLRIHPGGRCLSKDGPGDVVAINNHNRTF